jgi:hypothetical protein
VDPLFQVFTSVSQWTCKGDTEELIESGFYQLDYSQHVQLDVVSFSEEHNIGDKFPPIIGMIIHVGGEADDISLAYKVDG